jgi:signal peptidase II
MTVSVPPTPPAPAAAPARAPEPPQAAGAPRALSWQRPAVRYGFLAIVTLLTFAIDQVSKLAVKRLMQPGEAIPLLPPVLDLHYITNRGVAFGLFSRFGDAFVPLAIIIMTIILLYYRSLAAPRIWLRLALGLQLGGALGNLVDRLRFGSVVDFLDFHIDAINFHWPVFNMADSAIVVGVAILIAALTFQPDQPEG